MISECYHQSYDNFPNVFQRLEYFHTYLRKVYICKMLFSMVQDLDLGFLDFDFQVSDLVFHIQMHQQLIFLSTKDRYV